MVFVQPMPMDDVAAANRPVAAEIYTVKARATAGPAWNGMRLAQAPGTPGSPSPNPAPGSQLVPPGSPVPDDTVPPPRPNNGNNGRSPIDSSGSGAGMGSDPGATTREPPTPEPLPARPDAAAPSTPNPTTTPPPPIDDTKAPGVPDQTTGTGGTSGPMQTPPNQTTNPSTADPAANPPSTPAPAPAPSSSTAPPTAPPASTTPPPTDMGASGTR